MRFVISNLAVVASIFLYTSIHRPAPASYINVSNTPIMHRVSHELGVQPTRYRITADFMQHPWRTNRVYRVVMRMSSRNRHFFA